MTVSLSSILATPPTATSLPASAKLGDGKSVEQKFLDFAQMTPAQRLFAAMLAQLGITEDQFKAMDAAEQQKIADKIRDMIKQQAEKTNDTRTGLITDKSV